MKKPESKKQARVNEPPNERSAERDRTERDEAGHRRRLSNVGGPVEVAGDPAGAARLAECLSAADGTEDDTLTHGFHSYPAAMHPAVAGAVLDRFGHADARVLDPFCGGGTTLVEAEVRGLRARGVDLNPLAIWIAAVRTQLRDGDSRDRFRALLDSIAEASEERVRGRVDARAPLTREEARHYSGHILKELAGLREEILQVRVSRDRGAALAILSAIVVKFSRQRSDTSGELVDKRLRKGLVTEFWHRKGVELVDRWARLRAAAPADAREPRVVAGDMRRLTGLVPQRARFDLVLTSPPYGGTYDYATHHARRFPWLGIDRRELELREIGARRHLRGENAIRRWDRELGEALRAMVSRLAPKASIVMLIGDGRIERTTIDADVQVGRLAARAGLSLVASASQQRPDHAGGPPRNEHLLLLRPA